MESVLPLDPIAAVSHPDPYPYYAQLALAQRPQWYDGLGMWVIANPAHVAAVLAHPDAQVQPPPGMPDAFAQYARFSEGERHAELRAETIARIDALQIDDPPIATGDLDAFVECFSLYAMVRDVRSHVKGELLFQSYDATRGLIGNSLATLARDPSIALDDLVERTLRVDPPVHNTRRALAADIEIDGAAMQRGQTALVVLVATTFGQGRHACPGDVVAKRIADLAVRRVLASGTTVRLPVGYVPRPNVRIPLFNSPPA
jgi:cytochrome P450